MRLSIVTPSYNQGRFIQATIDSVLSQDYSDVEYLIMDGGSNDLTVPILKTYGDKIQWVSEPDGGQAAAVNKGILRATGDVIGWINSDDIYYPDAFKAVMKIFENHPEVNVLYGHAEHINEDGSYREDYYTEEWNYERLKEICFICQPAVFFRRETVLKYGLLNPQRHFAMDYDLWLRMGKNEEFYFLNQKLAGSRLYEENKTLGSVDKVHIDIMDALYEDLGYVPERWIEGSAHSIARSRGKSVATQDSYQEYKSYVVGLIQSWVDRYGTNPLKDLQKYPYSYQELKIGIDISITLLQGAAGIAWYVDSITKALAEIDTENQFLLYPLFYDREPINRLNYGLKIETKNVHRLFQNVTSSDCAYLKACFENENTDPLMQVLEYPDVVLCPAFCFSKNLAKRVATVYVISDVSFLEHPEYSTKANWDYCLRGMFDAALYADVFISISENTKRAFLKYFPFVDEKRIHVIPLSFREIFLRQVDAPKQLKSLEITEETSFWLAVGTVEPRKNLISLIHAYAKLKKRGQTFPLYIAGGKGWLDSEIYEEVKNLCLEKEIKFLGYVSDEQLSALYHSCYAFIYPSWYEGFGLPILEAMASGSPVICSNTTSMPEVGGDTVLYIDPYNIDSITEAMEKMQKDSKLREKLARNGYERAMKSFSWKKCAEDTYRCLYEAIVHHMKK